MCAEDDFVIKMLDKLSIFGISNVNWWKQNKPVHLLTLQNSFSEHYSTASQLCLAGFVNIHFLHLFTHNKSVHDDPVGQFA